ncbi:MAG: hypothetical protein ACXVPN_07560 [Bacteroidia bacterium]
MSSHKNILLTFDYEPYLGARSGSAQKCLLEPTEALRKILNNHKAKAIFFIDTLYLQNLKNLNEKADYESVCGQLKQLYSGGHFIFPHLHPHWKDAIYLNEQKEFSLTNLSHYSIANLQEEEIKKLFSDSLNSLKNIGISYEKWGYRAGGWCIQPFSKFKDIFTEQNIKYEFSVLPGYKNENPAQAFDFSSVNTQNPYFFSENVENPETKGQFVEFPISTLHFTRNVLLRDRLIRKYLWKTGDRGWGNGTSAQTEKLKSVYTDREMASIELLTLAKLNTCKKYLAEHNYMHWISHPKMFTKHGLKMFNSFLEFTNNKFEANYDFTKIEVR